MLQLKQKYIKKEKKVKIAIKDKQQEFVNNGERSKKSCTEILMNFKPKFDLLAPLRAKKIIESCFSDC